MLYEKERELVKLSIQEWISNEVFTYQWFIILGILIVVYTVWLKLVDRKRGPELLLLGSLMAVAKVVTIILISNELGLFYYPIRLVPLVSNIYVTSITVSPIIVMLAEQYAHSWKGFILWDAIGLAFLNFVIFPIYTAMGIVKFHNWNVFYHFLVLFGVSIITRVVFLWIMGTQKRLLEKSG
jgi:hypothetical protein